MKPGKPAFKDHFSGHAGDYANFRPTYPAALFQWLSDHSPDTKLAWDCATGNGQAARALAGHFDRVIATDASREQVEQAVEHPRIRFRVEPAEHSSLEPGSVDLVTVAQAYHWFDHDAFHDEVRRVLKPGGLLAAWTYTLAIISPAVDELVFELYEKVLGDYWPPERAYIDRNYQDFILPWNDIQPPGFSMTAHWSVEGLIGYLGTWSALRRYISDTGRNPMEKFGPALTDAWGPADRTRQVKWPLVVRACRRPRGIVRSDPRL